MRTRLLAGIILISVFPVIAQTDFSFRNSFRYGDGVRFNGFGNASFRYFENLTDVQIIHQDNYRFGLRYTQDSPAETGLRKEELSRWFAEYDTDSWTVRAGYSPGLFGRGLSLNLFEDRGLGFDSWMQGFNGEFRSDYVRFQVLAGRVDINDSLVFIRKDRYDLTGVNISLLPAGPVQVGLSAVHADGTGHVPGIPFNLSSDLSSVSLKSDFDSWCFYSEYLIRWTADDTSRENQKGSAFYSTFSFFSEMISLTLDYKNYRLDVADPILRLDPYRVFKLLPFQNPPTVQKEHSWFFLSRSLNEQDFNDQTGLQAEIFINPLDNLQLTLNGSFSSRTAAWILKPDGFSWRRYADDLLIFPSGSSKYSPFYEWMAEADVEWTPELNSRSAFGYRKNYMYNDFTGAPASHQQSDIIAMGWLQWMISDRHASQFQLEYQMSDDNYRPKPESNGYFFSWIHTVDRLWNVAIRFEGTDSDSDPGGRKDWTTIETGLRLDGRHLITLSAGQERGGLTCTNGVCRFIQPFSGVRVSVLSTF